MSILCVFEKTMVLVVDEDNLKPKAVILFGNLFTKWPRLYPHRRDVSQTKSEVREKSTRLYRITSTLAAVNQVGGLAMPERKATETERYYTMAGRNAQKVADLKKRVREIENFETYAVKNSQRQ